MTKRSLTGVLALVSMALLAGLWLALGGLGGVQEADALVASGLDPAQAIRPASGNDPVTLAAIPEDTGDRGLREDVIEASIDTVEGVSAARRGWWRAPKGAIWVHGRVELPVGTPLDEELWVMAEGSKFRERADGGRTHWARVENDGTFRVAFSSKTIKGQLELVGRYLYLDERFWINARKQVEEGEVLLEPVLGGRVVARVLPPRAVAMEYDVFKGVEVKAVRGGFMGATLCDGWLLEPGEYELGGLEPETQFEIIAISPRFADGRTEEVEVEAGGTTYIDVSLAMGAHLAGVVLDSEGNPVNDATVEVLSASQMAQRIPFMKLTPKGESTTANGKFDIVGVPPGAMTLLVEAEGFLDREVDLGDLTDNMERTTLTIQMDRGKVMSGVVKWPDGAYAEGAKVLVAQGSDFRGMEMERVVGEVVLGPDGGFEFGGLLESECNVTATAIHPDDMPDMSSKLSRMKMKRIPRWTARLEEVSPGARNLTLTLTSGSVLSGKVVDDVGKPVKIFKVTASPAGDNMISMSSMKPVKGRFKDDRGEFHLQGVEAGEWEVRVSQGWHLRGWQGRAGHGRDRGQHDRVRGERSRELRAGARGQARGARGRAQPGGHRARHHPPGRRPVERAQREPERSVGRLDAVRFGRPFRLRGIGARFLRAHPARGFGHGNRRSGLLDHAFRQPETTEVRTARRGPDRRGSGRAFAHGLDRPWCGDQGRRAPAARTGHGHRIGAERRSSPGGGPHRR